MSQIEEMKESIRISMYRDIIQDLVNKRLVRESGYITSFSQYFRGEKAILTDIKTEAVQIPSAENDFTAIYQCDVFIENGCIESAEAEINPRMCAYATPEVMLELARAKAVHRAMEKAYSSIYVDVYPKL